MLLEIYIPHSRSTVYRQVISRAVRTGFYDDQASTLTFSDILQLWRWWEDFTFVVWSAQKWVGFLVTINGRMVLPYSNDFYYQLQDIKHCYFAYSKSRFKATHCTDNCFGCQRLFTIVRNVTPGVMPYQKWFRYGRFIDALTWEIDKEAIITQLLFEADEALAANCPVFSADRIAEGVKSMPDIIKVGGSWAVEYNQEIGPSGLVRVPACITFDFDGGVKEKPPELPTADDGDIDKLLDDILAKRRRKG